MDKHRPFTFAIWLTRSLTWYWRQHALSALAIAVAIAVLAGALVVGWSLQASLERELMSRTGGMSYAVRPGVAFDGELAQRLRDKGLSVGGVLQLPAGGMNDAEPDVRTATLMVWGLGAASPPGWPSETDIGRDEVILGEPAAADLSAEVGDWVVIRADISSTRPASGLFHYRDPSELSRTLRLRVRSITKEQYAGFSLAATQVKPRNAFVRADVLLPDRQGGRANTLLASGASGAEQLRNGLREAVSLADLGITTTAAGGMTYLHSKTIAFPEGTAERLTRETAGLPLATHIAQKISFAGKHVSYGVIAATQRGRSPGEIGLNSWVAQDLGVKIGDDVQLSALISGEDGSYVARDVILTVAAIDPPGTGSFSPQVTPEVEGMTSAERMDDWKAPFPVDMGMVTPRDEEYWREYRAAPKAVISMSLMQELWKQSGFTGDSAVTTIVIEGELPGGAARSLAASIAETDPRWAVVDVQQSARAASKGSTDFAALFAAMSLFVVVASLLVGIGVVRTGLESRLQGMGLASALGVTGRSWRAMMLLEQAITCLPAIAGGVVFGILYGRLLLWLFVTLGESAWELPAVVLDARPAMLVVCGTVVSVLVLAAVRWQIRALLHRSARELIWGLAERTGGPELRRKRRTGSIVLGLVAVAVFCIVASRRGMMDSTAGFLGAGLCFLMAGWLWVRAWSLVTRRGDGCLSAVRLAMRFLTESPRRVRLTFLMFCVASFVISSVALFRSGEPAVDPGNRHGPTGGLSLRMTSPVAYRSDLSSESGRDALGLPRTLPPGMRIYSLLATAGVEGGCLNLASPEEMQVLGVPRQWVERGGFEVRTAERSDNPWALLDVPVGEDEAFPVFGDEETMQWIAYRKTGDVFTMPISGKQRTLRLAGVVRGGLFSGQLIMSEQNLRRLLPSAGYSMHFIEVPPSGEAEASELLAGLFDYGFSIEGTAQIINAVRSVQHLYMTLFLALGSLGLLLGAAGSAVVLVRDAAVRRGGLAMLQAIGLSRWFGATILAASHLVPVGLGIVVGMGSATFAYIALDRPTSVLQPVGIGAGIAVSAAVVMVLLARARQPRQLAEALRSV